MINKSEVLINVTTMVGTMVVGSSIVWKFPDALCRNISKILEAVSRSFEKRESSEFHYGLFQWDAWVRACINSGTGELVLIRKAKLANQNK